MAVRKPPTPEQLCELFRTGNVKLIDAPPYRAVPWDEACRHVRVTLHTTSRRAHEWLQDAVVADGSPLASLWVGSGLYISVRDRPGGDVIGRPIDWPEDVRFAVKFDYGGTLLPVTATRSGSGGGRWLVLRAVLPRIREVTEQGLRAVEDERVAQKAERDRAFTRIHGDDLTVITRLIAGIPEPADGSWTRDDLVDSGVAVDPRGTVAAVYGTPGRLTITLRGDQISLFADQLRAQRREEG